MSLVAFSIWLKLHIFVIDVLMNQLLVFVLTLLLLWRAYYYRKAFTLYTVLIVYQASSVFNTNDNNNATTLLQHLFDYIILKCFGDYKIIDTQCIFVMIQIFMISDCKLVVKRTKTKKCISSSILDQIDLTDVTGFRYLVMVLRVLAINVRCKKRLVFTNKLSSAWI